MRTFIVVGHNTTTSPDFTLDDLPGSAGRLDILCRCINSAFLLSHGIRSDVRVYLSLRNEVIIRFEGDKLRHVNPDERSTGALIKKALEKRPRLNANEEIESTPGIFISHRSLADILGKVETFGGQILTLHEAGMDIREVELENDIAFLLSDHMDFSKRENDLLKKYQKVSVGPEILHSDHTIIVVHNELDRRFNLPG